LEQRCLLAASSYTWQNVNIPAGGFVDGIFYDSHNANVIYARTDVGGLFKTVNDGTTWSQLLNFVGNNTTGSGNGTQYQEFGVLSFAMDPQNSNNLYADVGEYAGTNGNVLYSTNAGATWNTTPLSFYVGGNSNGRATGERIAVDPFDSNIVFLGSNDSGLWESTNAGHSFTQISSLSSSASINFVYFNPYGGTSGNPTQNIYVGLNSTSGGTNLYSTSNGGTTWTQVTGTGTLPTGWMPNRAAMASDGNLYLAYSNALTPNDFASNGGVFRYNTSTKIWANISPVMPQVTNGQYDQFGYVGLALDPNNTTTLVVTSFDRYNFEDEIWGTTNANASSPSWVTLYQLPTPNIYAGYDPTRNTTNAPYMASSGDGIGNWASDVAIDPFNSAQIMHTYGGGIWATNQGTSTTTLTAANSWYFPDTGIGMTALLGMAATTGGTPLFSAMGDVGGFAFTALSFSPTQGNIFFNGGGGNATSVDYAGLAPQDAVLVGNMGTTFGAYTTNGVTFTPFSAIPGGSSGNGTVAISANGSTIVWAPSGQAAYYSSNNGSSWTLSTLGASGALPTGGTILSDKVNPNYFYYWTENSSDNSWTLYISSNGGHTFSASAGGSLATGNPTLVVNPKVAGQLWLGTYVGIYESTNFGASFSHPNSYSTNVSSLAVGAAAPGSSYPAVYMYGTPAGNSFEGIYRSDDGGNTWSLLNSTNLQWGGTGLLAADPNVFGRVYLGAGGIIIGNPTTNLPANWIDTDINEPGNPGWATSSTTLSNGTTVNQWNLVGGGAGFSSTPIAISSLSRTGGVATAITSTASGLQVGQTITIAGATNSAYDGTFVVTGLYNTTAGLSNGIGAATEFTFAIASGTDTASGTITATLADQFNFAYKPVSGGASISAEILGMTNADGSAGAPQGGVMFRAGTNAADVFAALMQTTGNQLVFEYRTATGGTVSTVSLGSVPVGSEYIELTRSGNNFAAYYSSDNINWTQLGSTVAIAAMPITADVGLAATANFNPQLTSATFTKVTINLKGDINLDGHVNASDIGAMMQALVNLNTYQSNQNLSTTNLTVVADINGDGTVTNADLQALLTLLIGGRGSLSQHESGPSGTDSVINQMAPTSTLAPSADLNLAALDSTAMLNTADTVESSPSTADNATVVGTASVTDTSDKTPTTVRIVVKDWGNLPDSTAKIVVPNVSRAALSSVMQPSHFWSAAVDRYYDRLDQAALLYPKGQQIREKHHQSSEDLLGDSLIEPLLDFVF
jgi:hypothetical protein